MKVIIVGGVAIGPKVAARLRRIYLMMRSPFLKREL